MFALMFKGFLSFSQVSNCSGCVVLFLNSFPLSWIGLKIFTFVHIVFCKFRSSNWCCLLPAVFICRKRCSFVVWGCVGCFMLVTFLRLFSCTAVVFGRLNGSRLFELHGTSSYGVFGLFGLCCSVFDFSK